MTGAPAELAGVQGHDDFAMAAPTPDHFTGPLSMTAAHPCCRGSRRMRPTCDRP